ncbi:hypothetical protein [Enterovirga rhinocerotis]|uniref:PilZ domain-containing protein n=1 Tax=Enterovirga rhinocerotis TaxID=1339210 RepID=A0A4R7C806_9HYPH|nr:hypothetical protein [Enterovirga rhinocerotis]TDR93385.1 hypothetical protein EV668_0646 [Enterovirga rhinocerotis]
MNQSSIMYSQAAGGQMAADPARAGLSSIRHNVSKSGRIIFNAGQSTIACTIHALSEAEAEIRVASAAGVPPIFKLSIGECERLRPCRVVARDGQDLTVAFA